MSNILVVDDEKALVALMTVSYTHLDVYKRQPYSKKRNVVQVR